MQQLLLFHVIAKCITAHSTQNNQITINLLNYNSCALLLHLLHSKGRKGRIHHVTLIHPVSKLHRLWHTIPELPIWSHHQYLKTENKMKRYFENKETPCFQNQAACLCTYLRKSHHDYTTTVCHLVTRPSKYSCLQYQGVYSLFLSFYATLHIPGSVDAIRCEYIDYQNHLRQISCWCFYMPFPSTYLRLAGTVGMTINQCECIHHHRNSESGNCSSTYRRKQSLTNVTNAVPSPPSQHCHDILLMVSIPALPFEFPDVSISLCRFSKYHRELSTQSRYRHNLQLQKSDRKWLFQM